MPRFADRRPSQTLDHAARLLRGRANRHAWTGLGIAAGAIAAATLLVSGYEYGDYSLHNLLAVQQSNPALWLLDAMPLLFLVWGQHIGMVLSHQAGALILDEIRELRQHADRLQHELERTPVPGHWLGLPNRHGLLAAIDRAIAERELRTGAGFAVLVLATASYREIEPAHGEENARQFVAQLRDRLLAVAGEGDVLAHFGFDDFGLLLSHAVDAAEARRLAARVQVALETPLSLGRRQLSVRCGIGVACYPAHGNDAETLLRRAETAKYAASADGRALLLYEPALDTARGERSRLMAELHAALYNDALGEEYRLQAPLRADLPARLRLSPAWDHPRLGRLDETRFIDLPDRPGLAHDLSLWQLRKGLERLAASRDSNAGPQLVLRLPAAALRELALSDMILRLLSAHDLPASCLVLEMAEPTLADSRRMQRGHLDELRAAGVRIALTGVGEAGTSPLTPLDVALDECRVAESLLARAAQDDRVRAPVGALFELLKLLRVTVVAAGAHDAVQLQLAREFGADYAEGAAVPMPPQNAGRDLERPQHA